jgi:homoserine kinase
MASVSEKVSHGVRVSVPASASGFGPGAGTLGLALNARLEMTVRPLARSGVWVRVSGVDSQTYPWDRRNLCVQALWAVEDGLGVPRSGLEVMLDGRIPTKRGFGSSVASVVAATAAGLALSGQGDQLDESAFRHSVFALAEQMIRRPTATAASVFGSLVSVWKTSPSDVPRSIVGTARSIHRADQWNALPIRIPSRLRACVFIPQMRRSNAQTSAQADPEMAETTIREQIHRADAIANLRRQALLLELLARADSQAAQSNNPDAILFDATADAVRLPHISSVMPDAWQLINHLRSQGCPALLVGSGPSVLVVHMEPAGAQSASAHSVLRPTAYQEDAWLARIRSLTQSEWLRSGRWSLRKIDPDREGLRISFLD